MSGGRFGEFRFGERQFAAPPDIVQSGTSTSVASHSATEALADAASLTAVAAHTATEALADAIGLTSASSHTAGEALADASSTTGGSDHTGGEALADATVQTSIGVPSGAGTIVPALSAGTGGLIGVDYFLAETLEAKRRKVPIRQRGLNVSRAVVTGTGEVTGYEQPDELLVAMLMD